MVNMELQLIYIMCLPNDPQYVALLSNLTIKNLCAYVYEADYKVTGPFGLIETMIVMFYDLILVPMDGSTNE